MKHIITYFDWNIFNKIENSSYASEAEGKMYQSLEQAMLDKRIVAPYSNAHINDLVRGYKKDPSYIEGHLNTLKRLTKNLCITQYWGEPKARWHFREITEYFNSALEASDLVAKDFYSLFSVDSETDLTDVVAEMHKLRCELMKLQPVDKKFKQVYKEDPIFGTIYPRTKVEMNQYALCEDLYAFAEKIKTDYLLYKSYRKYLVQLKLKYPQLASLPGIVQILRHDAKSQLTSITWDSLWEDMTPHYKPSSNPAFDKLFDHFVKTDLKGYRPDERFANLIDDALHVFYGSQCTYFVTIDGRCYDKARIVYEKFAPCVKAVKPQELIKDLKLDN